MNPFEYISTLLSIIIGLGITHLLIGVSRFIYNPKGVKIYWIHLVWTFSIFMILVWFWWHEFGFSTVSEWTFQKYFFIIIYAVLLFLLSVINIPFHFPDNFKDYYYSSKRWFFLVGIAVYAIDVLDSYLKGSEYFGMLGLSYLIYIACSVGLCILAIFTRKEILHGIIAIFFALCQIWFAITAFSTISA